MQVVCRKKVSCAKWKKKFRFQSGESQKRSDSCEKHSPVVVTEGNEGDLDGNPDVSACEENEGSFSHRG